MEHVPEPGRLDRMYQAIVDEEDARACTDISDDACQYVPRNFFLIGACQTLSNLGDHLANPKTVLAWLLGAVGAPASLVALLVPIRESGSMIPQLVIGSFVRRLPRRKMVWVAGAVLQAAAVLGIGLVAASLVGRTAGWLIILLLAMFSLSRGLNSVASKDVLGKTIPKRRRGRLSGFGATASGCAAIVVGLYMGMAQEGSDPTRFYVTLLIAAAVLWVVAGFVYANIQEFAGETAGGANALFEAVKRLDLLRTDRDFRRFVITRALLLCSALSAPYYVVLAQQTHGTDLKSLGWFILANALATSLSASFWGIMADVSSRRVLLAAAVWAAVLGLGVFAVSTLDSPLRDWTWTYPIAFFLLGIAHSGVRIGRKTYIVDMAGGNRRTDYVAVSNTVIGVILLLTGLLAPLSSHVTPAGIILLLSICGLIGALTCVTLPETE
ncbi:MAG TPA: MFS transporter [Phycisphaerae bacterium]|nr:MFS transporter [Phycisphaerae bacterium]